MRYEDYYKTLGVSRSASQDEIQKAYRKQARKYHPDINKDAGAEDQFKKVNEAYEVLKNPDTRRQYDALGSNWKHGQRMGGMGGGFPGGMGGMGGMGGGFPGGGNMGGMSDFFQAIFGGGGMGGGGGFPGGMGGMGGGFPGGMGGMGGGFPGGGGMRPQKGQDKEVELSLSLSELNEGTTREITFRTQSANGMVQTRTQKVRIPLGATDGKVLRIPGKGQPGKGGGPAGDLRIKLKVASDSTFEVKGHNLTVGVPVEAWKAVLGGSVEVPILGGSVTMKIPAGVQGGQKLRLKGKGLPKNKTDRGDLYARLDITVPKKPSDQERELYQALAALASEA